MVPSIRFKGFSGDWEKKKLSQCVTEVKRVDENSIAPVMMISASGGFINQSERYSFNNAGKSLKKYTLIKKGELAYNHGASKLRPYGSCFTLIDKEQARIPFVYHCFSVNDNNSVYMATLLNSKSVERQLKRIVSSGVRMDGLLNISFDEYTSIPITLPDIEEQSRIADLITKLDNLITLHQRKLDQLKKLKKYFLQNMFPAKGEKVPRIRFKGFTGDWEQCKLGSIAIINPKSELPEQFKYIDLESVVGTSLLGYSVVERENAPSRAQRLAIEGDVFYQTVRPYQRNNYLYEETDRDYVFSTGYAQLRTSLDSYFLLTLLQNDNFVKIVLDNCTGTSYPAINSSALSKIPISTPKSIDETIKIGNTFRKLDNLITLHQRKLDQLQTMKKFMLQNMFI